MLSEQALTGCVMLDMAGIVLSSVMILMVIVRAVQRDRVQPWFQTLKQARIVKTRNQLDDWRRR